MQLKTGGFPPFVVNIWYIGTEDGVITATRLENVPGMTLDDLADPALPWEVFFWTAR